jgi:hypothetical protein
MQNSKSRNDRMSRAEAHKPANYRKAWLDISKRYGEPTAAHKAVRTRLYSTVGMEA